MGPYVSGVLLILGVFMGKGRLAAEKRLRLRGRRQLLLSLTPAGSQNP